MLKYFFQITIIFVITFVGEILEMLFPLPIPGSIYGLMILFFMLCTGMLKAEHVEEAAQFLLTVMPAVFVPAAVSLMTKWSILQDNIIEFVITCIVSTIVVMSITGSIAEILLKRKSRRCEK